MSEKLPANNVLSSIMLKSLAIEFHASAMACKGLASICATNENTVGDLPIADLQWTEWSEEALDAAKNLKEIIERDIIKILTRSADFVEAPEGDAYEGDGPGWGPGDDDDYDTGVSFPSLT